MGYFTKVKINNKYLPDYLHNKEWQTYDIIEKLQNQLTIDEDGCLWITESNYYHETSEYDKKVIINYFGSNSSIPDYVIDGYSITSIPKKYKLSYTGKANFCTSNGKDVNSNDWKLIEYVAKFDNGILIYLEEK